MSEIEKITNPKEYEICKFDGVNVSGVYIGSFDNLEQANLNWHKEFMSCLGMEVETLTLQEIQEQIYTEEYKYIITVFVNSPLQGEIIQCGNYGDDWYKIGSLCGYA